MEGRTEAQIEAEVKNICEICSLVTTDDQAKVRRAVLKGKDTETVINDYFNDQNKFHNDYSSDDVAHTWNEEVWAAGREGPPTFNIQGADDTGGVLQGVAPDPYGGISRPPSRTQNRSPLGAPISQEQENADLQRAIAASTAPSGGATPQETGVTEMGTNLPLFGPATRSSYEQDEWAMVRTSQDTTDPSPSARLREAGVPVFLRCRQSNKKHRLGPVLMVLHEIPAARNTLLKSGIPPATYGHDNAWWKGQKIATSPKQLAEADAWQDTTGYVNISHELQRLMAFLDDTDRSYGTADSLLEVPHNSWNNDVVIVGFVALCEENSGNIEVLRSMWTEVMEFYNIDEQQYPKEESFGFLQLYDPPDRPELVKSLYSLWDCLFWLAQDWSNTMPDRIACIDKPAEVLTMRLNQVSHTFTIPDVFYLDRYMYENKSGALDMQSKMAMALRSINSGKERLGGVNNWVSPQTSQVHNKAVLLKEVIAREEEKIWRIKADALWRKHEKLAGTEDEFPYLPGQLIHLAELDEDEEKAINFLQSHIKVFKQKLARIDQKMARVQAEMQTCYAFLEKLGNTMTGPDDNERPEWKPTRSYTLRGVVTSPDIVYIRRREPLDLIQMDIDYAYVENWWRLAWVDGEGQPKLERTTGEKVREAIFSEGDEKAPILVYASEKALTEELLPLSPALQTFVKFDNRFFKQERLEEPSPRDKKRSANQSPQSPFKRQARGRSNSVDSMDTNRASLGDLSDVDERAGLLDFQQEDPFQTGDGTMGIEDRLNGYKPLSPPISSYDGSERGSPKLGRQALRLANVSLDETIRDSPPRQVTESQQQQQQQQQQEEEEQQAQFQAKSPEMQERASTLIIKRPPVVNSTEDRVPIMDRAMTMEIDGVSEADVEPPEPESYYK